MDFISKSDFTTVGGRNNAQEEEKKQEEFNFTDFDNTQVAVAEPAVKAEESPEDKDFFNFKAEDTSPTMEVPKQQNETTNFVGDLMDVFATTNAE